MTEGKRQKTKNEVEAKNKDQIHIIYTQCLKGSARRKTTENTNLVVNKVKSQIYINKKL